MVSPSRRGAPMSHGVGVATPKLVLRPPYAIRCHLGAIWCPLDAKMAMAACGGRPTTESNEGGRFVGDGKKSGD